MHSPPALALLLVSACTALPDDALALQSHVDRIAATGVVGVQAVATVDDTSSWAAAGVARLDDGAAITPAARFRIASTTKTFVAAATLQLVADGTLALDDDVETWLPGVVTGNGNDGAAITIRHLLQHRSGLANHVDDQIALLVAAGSRAEVDAILLREWTSEELVALAVQHSPHFAPGEGWAYTDTGYVLVGMILEAATGTPWQTHVAERVLAPLALADTFAPSDAAIPGAPMHAYAHLPFADAPHDVTFVAPSALDAAAALVGTPADVQTFFSALLAGELLDPSMLAQMTATIDVGDGMRYGLGIAETTASCGTRYWTHDGDTLGMHTRTAIADGGDPAVVLALSGDGEFEGDVAELVDAVICR